MISEDQILSLCNSLNAMAGTYRRKEDGLSQLTSIYFQKAQCALQDLLEENRQLKQSHDMD